MAQYIFPAETITRRQWRCHRSVDIAWLPISVSEISLSKLANFSHGRFDGNPVKIFRLDISCERTRITYVSLPRSKNISRTVTEQVRVWRRDEITTAHTALVYNTTHQTNDSDRTEPFPELDSAARSPSFSTWGEMNSGIPTRVRTDLYTVNHKNVTFSFFDYNFG